MTAPGDAGGPDPERILAQALRAMAGGGRGHRDAAGGGAPARAPLTVLQIVLIATIVGLTVGMTVGLITLLA